MKSGSFLSYCNDFLKPELDGGEKKQILIFHSYPWLDDAIWLKIFSWVGSTTAYRWTIWLFPRFISFISWNITDKYPWEIAPSTVELYDQVQASGQGTQKIVVKMDSWQEPFYHRRKRPWNNAPTISSLRTLKSMVHTGWCARHTPPYWVRQPEVQ